MNNSDFKKSLSLNDIILPDLDLPLAVMVHADGRFTYVNNTECYLQELQSIGFDTLEDAEYFFNNKDAGIYDRYLKNVQYSLDTNSAITKSFVAKDCYVTIKIRCFYSNNDKNIIICRAFLLNVSKYKLESNTMDKALRSLYSLYDHINYIDLKNNSIQHIYTNVNIKELKADNGSFNDYITIYAKEFIYPSEQKKYLNYYDPDNIKSIFNQLNKRFNISYFRTRNVYGDYEWKAYLIIKAIDQGDECYYGCVREVDLTKEHILIDNNYIDLFYNMPVAYSIFKVKKYNNEITDIVCLFASKMTSEIMSAPLDKIVGHSIFDKITGIREWKGIFDKAAYYNETFSQIKYIEYSGKWVRITVSQAAEQGKCAIILEDVTNEQEETNLIGKNWRTDDLIITCTKYLNSDMPYKDAINNILRVIGQATGAGRVYVFERNKDNTYSENFLWSKTDFVHDAGILQNLKPSEIIFDWDNEYKSSTTISVDNFDFLKEEKPLMYELFLKTKTKKIIETPIRDGNNLLGFMGLADTTDSVSFDIKHLIETLAYFVSYEMIRNQLITELENKSIYDSLCDIKNRNAMEITVKELKGKAIPIGIVYADANGLKQVNDTMGHEAGDSLIRYIASTLAECFGRDNTYRSGGDEFVAIIENITKEDFADKAIEVLKIFGKNPNVSVAMGWAYSDSSADIESIMKRADERMYINKAEHYKKNNRRKS
ncbi:MAG: GGDEF domain-containing protein [Butyrivibrio sp.]|nr:GGDEF domain-containing protein [Butyrivibrio sp.]